MCSNKWNKFFSNPATFPALITAISTIIVALVAAYITYSYNESQKRILQMQTIEKFIPHLESKKNTEVKAALVAISALGNPPVALALSDIYSSAGGKEGGDAIMASATSGKQIGKTSIIISAPSNYTDGDAKAGWVYLGSYSSSSNKWTTQYFKFAGKSQPQPKDLETKIVSVNERTGQLNVRNNMPSPQGEFSEITDVLEPKSEVKINAVKEWQSSGYMWANISYKKKQAIADYSSKR